jgi:hypothetical protein
VYFYCARAGEADAWKVQPEVTGGLWDANWWLPVLNRVQKGKPRAPQHWLFATVRQEWYYVYDVTLGRERRCVRQGSRL